MRITGLGHAGMFIETAGGSILCDPWVKPAFYGSWFPFPDNRALDWEKYGKADFLYVSHRHRDHFDPWLLETLRPEGHRGAPARTTRPMTSSRICGRSATTTSSTRTPARSSSAGR